jgi:hypothetical protein
VKGYDPLAVNSRDWRHFDPFSLLSLDRASGATLVLWAVTLTAGKSWLAQAGLTLILVILLIGGILLFVFGIRDLIRDLRRFLRVRSEKKSHA